MNNITPYLVSGRTIYVRKRSMPLSLLPTMTFGNMPNDGGNLLLSDNEKNDLLEKYPSLNDIVKKFIGSNRTY